MAKALYYNENGVGKEFDVLAENKEAGTVDIGTGKTVVVKGVKVLAEPKPGFVTISGATPEPKIDLTAEKTAAEKPAKTK